MAMNPDFTKLNLEEHPHCSYDEWKAELEKTTGKNYDALYENTMAVSYTHLTLPTTSRV